MVRTLVITLSLLFGMSSHSENQGGDTEVVPKTDLIAETNVVLKTDVVSKTDLISRIPKNLPLAETHPELHQQLRNPRVQPMSYWDKVAQCETGGNWKDKGNFSGGLGIAQSTWQGYGGYQFARTPARATRLEQITIANRISVTGYQTKNVFLTLDDKLNNKPYFRPASGFYGWGCIKNNKYLHPKKRKP